MDYIEVNFVFDPVANEEREIIAALLGEIEFESFSDTKTGLQAYIQAPLFHEAAMKETLEVIQPMFTAFNYTFKTIAEQNWNAAWEKNFTPIKISDNCRIRAPFHEADTRFEFDLIIEPKMSFGTGHHATTALMLQMLLEMDLKGKEILDMGCGTGVLAILASLKDARKILAVDIDEWSYENTIENAARNRAMNITVKLGDAALIAQSKFNVILANINRNILLQDMPMYAKSLSPSGQLVLSGFYTQDLPLILDKAKTLGLNYLQHLVHDDWVAVKFFLDKN